MHTQTLQRLRAELESASTLHLAMGRIATRANPAAPTAWTGPLLEELEDLTDDQARSTPTVSAMSLLAIVKHSAIWERRWFQVVGAGRRFPDEWPSVRPDPGDDADVDPTFVLDAGDTVASVLDRYRREIAAADEVLATADLDRPCGFGDIPDTTLRWIALHMIEETAQHRGHLDLLYENLSPNPH